MKYNIIWCASHAASVNNGDYTLLITTGCMVVVTGFVYYVVGHDVVEAASLPFTATHVEAAQTVPECPGMCQHFWLTC